MRIAIAGGNGFIGREVTAQLTGAGHEVVWLSHRPGRTAAIPENERPTTETAFDLKDPEGPWAAEIARADAVANLSGFPISARWNAETKVLIESSRMESTRAIVDAIARARARDGGPEVLVNASAVGYYGERGDDILTEELPPGTDWLSALCVRWEDEARRAEDAGARVVRIRTGIVMGAEGALPRMVTPMRLLAGGPLGSGRQWLSWVHRVDIAGLYCHALTNAAVEGALNGGAPEPLRSSEFSAALGRAMGRPSWMPVPRFALRIVLGESADGFLMSQRMSAEKARRSGYAFRFPEAEAALRDLLAGM